MPPPARPALDLEQSCIGNGPHAHLEQQPQEVSWHAPASMARAWSGAFLYRHAVSHAHLQPQLH